MYKAGTGLAKYYNHYFVSTVTNCKLSCQTQKTITALKHKYSYIVIQDNFYSITYQIQLIIPDANKDSSQAATAISCWTMTSKP